VTLWAVAAAVLALNLPFGYWRQGVRKFSLAWFVAVHAPVPIVAILRAASGLGFQWSTLPVMLAAYFLGQFLGGWLRARRERAPAATPTRSSRAASSSRRWRRRRPPRSG
jgi:hypothetical protein